MGITNPVTPSYEAQRGLLQTVSPYMLIPVVVNATIASGSPLTKDVEIGQDVISGIHVSQAGGTVIGASTIAGINEAVIQAELDGNYAGSTANETEATTTLSVPPQIPGGIITVGLTTTTSDRYRIIIGAPASGSATGVYVTLVARHTKVV
jgi:hypothetical protein